MENAIEKQAQIKPDNRKFMKRLYGPADFYRFLRNMMMSVNDMRYARRNGLVNSEFGERIMLAVTEVNGCRYCSYFHTRVALKTGLQADEIRDTLSGDFSHAPQDEMIALIFAQHYADSAELPDPEAVNVLFENYGEAKSKGILAYIRAIMVGNAWGNAFDSLRFRFMGKPNPELNLCQEVSVIFGPFYMLPVILIQNVFKK